MTIIIIIINNNNEDVFYSTIPHKNELKCLTMIIKQKKKIEKTTNSTISRETLQEKKTAWAWTKQDYISITLCGC